MIRSSAAYPTSATEASEFAPFLTTVAAVCLTGMLVVGQLYLVIPLLPGMAADWGVDTDAATATATVFGIGYALGFLFWGPLSDTLGRRRMIVGGLLANAILAWSVGLAPGLFAAGWLRVLQGFFAASFAPPAYAYFGEKIEPRVRVVALTCLTSSFLASGVISQMASQAVYDLTGWQGVFTSASLALCATAAVLWWVLLDDGERQRSRPLDAFVSMGRLLIDPRMLGRFGATVTILLSFVAIYAGLQLAGPEEIAGNPTALLWLRASAVPAMVAIPLLTPKLARVPAVRRIIVALVVAAAAVAWVGASDPGVLGLGMVLFVFVGALAVASPGLVESITARAGRARGGGVALYTFSLFVGASLGPQLAVALRRQGFSSIAFAVAGVLLCGAVLTALSIEAGE